MTEKRFTVEPTLIRECIVDNTTGEQLDTFDYTERLCEFLNELHEEKQLLQNQVDFLEEFLKSGVQYEYYQKVHEENEQLKTENENLKKSIKCMDETVKEQCIKLDWASECGVKWDKEFKNWKGYE